MSQVTCEGPSYVYIVPLPDEELVGWQEIDGYRYYFTDEGQMLSVAMVGPYCIDWFGVCMNYR